MRFSREARDYQYNSISGLQMDESRKNNPLGGKPLLGPEVTRISIDPDATPEDESTSDPERKSVPLASLDEVKTVFLLDEPEEETVRFGCPRCMHALKTPVRLIGEIVRCPTCFLDIRVPKHSRRDLVPEEELYTVDASPIDAREMQERRMDASFPCPICHTNIGVKRAQAGSEMTCPDCHAKITVPMSVLETAREKIDKQLDGIFDGLDASADTYELSANNRHEKFDPSEVEARKERDKNRLPVYCDLCHTLMYAEKSQIGEKLTCPDCGTKTPVREPLPEPPKEEYVTADFEGANQYDLIVAEEIESDGLYALAEPSKSTLPAAPKQPPEQDLVPVVCSHCSTRMYANEEQIGTMKTCPDCGTQTMVLRVASNQEPTAAVIETYGISASEHKPREVRSVTDYRYLEGSVDKESLERKDAEEAAARKRKAKKNVPGAQKKSPQSEKSGNTPPLSAREEAEEIDLETLRRRKERNKEREMSDGERLYQRPILPDHPLTDNIFQPFKNSEFVSRLGILFILGAFTALVWTAVLPYAAAVVMFSANILEVVLFVCISIPAVFFTLVWFSFLATYCMSVFNVSSAGNDNCDDWSDYTLVNGLISIFWIGIPATMAAIPGYFIYFVFSAPQMQDSISLGGVSPLSLIMILLSLAIFFPLTFLASIEVGIPFPLIALNTFSSLRKLPGVWLRFIILTFPIYFFSGLVIGLVLMFGFPISSRILSFLVMILLVAIFSILPILLFRMFGRLAWIIEDTTREAETETI